jgi:hypothetical protein
VPAPAFGAQPPTQPPATQPPGAQEPVAAQAPSTDAFAQAPPGGGEAAQTALPNMVGDLGFYGLAMRAFSPQIVTTTTVTPALTPAQINQQFNLIPPFPTPGVTRYLSITSPNGAGQVFTAAQLTALTQPTTSATSTSVPPPSGLANRVPVTSFGAFKISDNESVQPVDRVFATYNYYDLDGFHGNSSSLNREMIGFEKTFLDGAGSFGMRLPYTQVGEGLGGTSDVDALSLIVKYAAYRNAETGCVVSGGLVVTVPTGPDVVVGANNAVNPTLLQPYLGYAFGFGRCYVQGFCEIVIPTDDNLPTFVGNDIGMGYRCESVPIIPIFEVHINDALNHQGSGATPIGFVDQVVLTGGFHTIIGKSLLTVGVATPVTGPRLDSIEAVVQFNCRF